MNSLQKYFRDAIPRLGLTQEKIAEMCVVDRTTVTKWMNPEKDHIMRKDALMRYREYLVKEGLYEEAGIFEQKYHEVYSDNTCEYDMYESFETEYNPLGFNECLNENKSIMPDFLYNVADIYELTNIFPGRLHFEMLFATARYGDRVKATDTIFPGKMQIEKLRYENLYEIRKRKLEKYGLTEKLFTGNILELKRIPRHMGDIPEPLREKVYKERINQLYCDGENKNCNTLLNVITGCNNGEIIISVLPRDELTNHEKERLAAEIFLDMYLSDTKITHSGISDLFRIRTSDNKDYSISLTEQGKRINDYFSQNTR